MMSETNSNSSALKVKLDVRSVDSIINDGYLKKRNVRSIEKLMPLKIYRCLFIILIILKHVPHRRDLLRQIRFRVQSHRCHL